MSWLSLILGVLKFVNLLIEIGQQNKWIKVGEDQAIARAVADVFKKTEHAKQISERINALPDDEVDDLLARLEPGDVPKPASR